MVAVPIPNTEPIDWFWTEKEGEFILHSTERRRPEEEENEIYVQVKKK